MIPAVMEEASVIALADSHCVSVYHDFSIYRHEIEAVVLYAPAETPSMMVIDDVA
jgi:hypothetical protein